MFYFVGIDLPHAITGVDRAMFNRIKLFKSIDQPAKILYFNYYPLLYRNTEKFGVTEDVLYLYDHFHEVHPSYQGPKQDWLAYFKDVRGYIPVQVNTSNDYMLYYNAKLVAYVRFTDSELNQIDFLSYYDTNLKKIKEDIYDYRGFKSSTTYYDNEERAQVQHIYSIDGQVKVERYFDVTNQSIKHVIVHETPNDERIFVSNDAFLAYCMEQFYKEGDLFIIDRPFEMVPVFNLVDQKIPAAVVMHAVPYNNMYDSTEIQFQYQTLIPSANRFNAIIVSTEQQKADVERIIDYKTKVFAIPVGFVSHEHQPLENHNNKKANQLISIARYENGKQHEHQFRLIQKLVKDFPDIELHLYGYGSFQEKFRQMISEMQLQKHIFIHHFVDDLTPIYNQASLSIFTSNSEGFALSILESIIHHTPVIAYDIKYGPSEMIIDGVNGNLVARNDEDALYHTVKAFLSDESLQTKYYQQCYQSIQKFNEDAIAQKWLNFTQYDIY